jgi:uncharacterized protein YabE (DUF348 family)
LAVRATRLRRLRVQRAIQATTLVIGLVAVGLTITLAVRKDLTLVVGTRPNAISTTSSSVQELLDSTGLPLSVGLQVRPPPATALADGMTVVVSAPPGLPADAVWATVDPRGVGVWVVERPDEGLFGKAVIESGAATTVPVAVGQLPVVSVQAVVSGKVHDVLTNASTAGELLSAMGIQSDADDRVEPPPSTPLHGGEVLRYDRVDVLTQTVTAPIPSGVRTAYSHDLVPGVVRVVDAGSDGLRADTLRLTLVNGVQVSRERVATDVIEPATPETRISGPYSMYGGTIAEPGTGATSQAGLATWYDPPWGGLTAAHPWLPFGTYVTATDVESGRSVTVVIDDRGPFAPGRIIDLSPEAFERLAPLGRGVLHVELTW